MSYVIKKVGNFNMFLKNGATGIHNDLMKIAANGGEREPELLFLLKNEIQKDSVVMDLGANIGYITLLMANLVGDTGIVYAIEPDKENFELLNKNIFLNNIHNVITYNVAISNKIGTADFYTGKACNLGGLVKTSNTNNNSFKVQLLTLEEFCKNEIFPDLIKMDIEGHEVEVLEGMIGLIKSIDYHCKIILELHPTMYNEEHSLEKQLMKFFNNGFNTKYVVSAAVEVPYLFKTWGYTPIKTFETNRALYTNMSKEHILKACCYTNQQWMEHKKKYSPKIARFLMIER